LQVRGDFETLAQLVSAQLPSVVSPATLDEALGELARLGDDGAPLAGCTWIMRGGLRREPFKRAYVALRDVEELRRVEHGERTELGPMLTHAELARLDGPLALLAEAARRSASPTIRSVATLGGNLCARGFAEAELATALVALEAELELDGRSSLGVEEYLARRPAGLVTRVRVRGAERAAYQRLTVLGGGEYPVACAAVAFADGGVRVAVGAVEESPRRWRAAEAALAAGEEPPAADELDARDDALAPAWYRRAVLPKLVEKAAARCRTS